MVCAACGREENIFFARLLLQTPRLSQLKGDTFGLFIHLGETWERMFGFSTDVLVLPPGLL